MLLLEEYGPEIVYIKDVNNIVSEALRRLEYDLKKTHKGFILYSVLMSHDNDIWLLYVL